jgi:hypothetical protein
MFKALISIPTLQNKHTNISIGSFIYMVKKYKRLSVNVRIYPLVLLKIHFSQAVHGQEYWASSSEGI